MKRCKGHIWDWLRDDYTTARYGCCNCGRERGVWKNRTVQFESHHNVRTRRPVELATP